MGRSFLGKPPLYLWERYSIQDITKHPKFSGRVPGGNGPAKAYAGLFRLFFFYNFVILFDMLSYDCQQFFAKTMPFKMKQKLILGFLGAFFVTALTSLKLSFIHGSSWAFFSLNQNLTPAFGFFFGPWATIFLFISKTCILLLSGTMFGLPLLCHHLPTLSGGLYLTSTNRLFKVSIPLLCMVLFVCHPIGFQSMVYTLYWVTPIVAAFYVPRSFFLRSLASTLTIHAVGSTLWLYTHSTNPLFWHSLLPVVAVERLLFAMIMTAAYYGLKSAAHCVNRLFLGRAVHE